VIDALLAEARSDEQRVAALIARAFAALMAVDHPAGIAAAVQAAELARGWRRPGPASRRSGCTRSGSRRAATRSAA
jgi:hypothetical protein